MTPEGYFEGFLKKLQNQLFLPRKCLRLRSTILKTRLVEPFSLPYRIELEFSDINATQRVPLDLDSPD